MTRIRAAITGIEAFLPDYILNNDELSRIVDTSDEWIMQRIGIKERRIHKGEGKATSDMAADALKKLLVKKNINKDEIDLLICATMTGDMILPATACIICEKVGISNIMAFDINAACSGFIYGLEIATNFIESGRYKKIIVIAADQMSSVTNYSDRTICPLFGDGAAAILIEPTTEEVGVMDSILRSDGVGSKFLHIKAGGSLRPATHETVDNKEHFVYQEGQTVFKYAVSRMADVSVEIMERNNLTEKDISWLVPHQANSRIIEAVGNRIGIDKSKVMINIERYGNTTAATIPICLWEWEKQLKKGDNLIISAFGGGFTWGSIYLKWAYNSE